MQLKPIAAHHKTADNDFAFMNHFVVFGTQWNEIVAVVLVKMLDVSPLIGVFLRLYMVDFFDVFIAQSAFGEVEIFIVFAAFFLF